MSEIAHRKQHFFYITISVLDLGCQMLEFSHCGPDDPWFHKMVAIKMIMDDPYGHLAAELLAKNGNPQGMNMWEDVAVAMAHMRKKKSNDTQGMEE